MGSLLGSIVEDILMTDLEQKCKTIINKEALHVKYVNNTFVHCNRYKRAESS